MFCKGGVAAVRGSPHTLVFALLSFSITLFSFFSFNNCIGWGWGWVCISFLASEHGGCNFVGIH